MAYSDNKFTDDISSQEDISSQGGANQGPHLRGRGHGKVGARVLSWILSLAGLTAFDQLTKYLAQSRLEKTGKEFYVLVPDVLQLRYLENRGAAFGMMQNRLWIFTIFAILVLVLTFWIYMKSPEGKHFLPLRISMCGLAAGALGNLIDRVFRGYVIDFIYFRIINFPIFNFADICVSLSVALLLILIIFVYREGEFSWLKRKNKKQI